MDETTAESSKEKNHGSTGLYRVPAFRSITGWGWGGGEREGKGGGRVEGERMRMEDEKEEWESGGRRRVAEWVRRVSYSMDHGGGRGRGERERGKGKGKDLRRVSGWMMTEFHHGPVWALDSMEMRRYWYSSSSSSSSSFFLKSGGRTKNEWNGMDETKQKNKEARPSSATPG